MLREIKLYGQLAKFVGQKLLQAEISTAAEAVRFLIANFPGLDQHMAERHYKVIVGHDALALDEIHNPSGQQVIKIVPVVAGAGGSFGSILIGALLIGASFFFPGAGLFGTSGFFGAGLATTTTAAGVTTAVAGASIGTALSFVGASLILGGVAQLISPVPTTSIGSGSNSDPRKSFSFSGVQNVSRQGVPVNIIFGEVVVGSVTVSAGIDIAQVTA